MGQQGRNAGHRTGNLDRRALIKGTAAAVAAGAIVDVTSAGTTA